MIQQGVLFEILLWLAKEWAASSEGSQNQRRGWIGQHESARAAPAELESLQIRKPGIVGAALHQILPC